VRDAKSGSLKELHALTCRIVNSADVSSALSLARLLLDAGWTKDALGTARHAQVVCASSSLQDPLMSCMCAQQAQLVAHPRAVELVTLELAILTDPRSASIPEARRLLDDFLHGSGMQSFTVDLEYSFAERHRSNDESFLNQGTTSASPQSCVAPGSRCIPSA
jgi:hypothetical protein